ncbi:MAG: adenylosuccinate synthase [Pseudomonadota bacterium]
MQTLAIIGAQWGDEGKGKITDLLAAKSDLVARYQGGNNAGHTIIVKGRKIVLHLIPSGILHSHCLSVVGHGVVFDPQAFKEELETLEKNGVQVSPPNLMISQNCPVITQYHRLLDAVRESQGPVKIGTTGRGIGPAYEDKVSRKAIKLGDLLDKNVLSQKLKENFQEKEILFKHLYKTAYPSLDEEASRLYELGQTVAPFLGDTFSTIDSYYQQKKKILFEGAQGTLLDIDYGTYPFVTSSNTSFGGIYTGAGLPGQVDEVLGICKAYTTRVGEGPFPTELKEARGEEIRRRGHEFGATTGRPRRTGWLDIPILKYAVKASNLTSIALTKIDILCGMSELKMCTAYRFKGKTIDCAYPGIDLNQAEAVYQDMPMFDDNFQDGKISNNLQNYVRTIEEMVGIPVGILAFGPERSQIVFRRDYF